MALTSGAEVVWCIMMVVATLILGRLHRQLRHGGLRRTYGMVLLFDLIFGHVESCSFQKGDVQLRACML